MRRRARGAVRILCAAMLAGHVLAAGFEAAALINPRFTPVHMTEQSELILVLRLGPVSEKGEIAVKLVKCLKGTKPETAPKLDLTDMDKEYLKELLGLVRGGDPQLALLYAGDYKEEGAGEGDMGGESTAGRIRLPPAALNVRGKWFSLEKPKEKANAWPVILGNSDLLQTWNGATEMLLAVTEYALQDPDPSVPSVTGAAWSQVEKVASVNGKVRGALPVDVRGDGVWYVHVWCESGDAMFTYDRAKKQFEDHAAAMKLGAKSAAAAWGDFNGDGRLDLASWDGKALVLRLQEKDGTFAAKAAGVEWKGGCRGLAVVGVGEKGRAGLVVSTDALPALVMPAENGGFAAGPLAPADAAWPGKEFGEAYGCVVADFDGDVVPDVVQPFERGALFYKGKGQGVFDPPKPCREVGAGKVHAKAFTGDFDHDGLLDIFVAAEEHCFLWSNQGGGRFVQAMEFTGEASYISQPYAHDGMVCDINNDGRQDIFITYSNRGPHVFFNRGYRSFGHAHDVDLPERQLGAWTADEEERRREKKIEEDRGQQAGVMFDLDRDGAQDMFIVLDNGEVWVAWHDTNNIQPLCVHAAAPASAPAGPARVVAWNKKRLLGAWAVTPGVGEAFFGRQEPGRFKLQWQYPGAAPREKEIVVEKKPERVLLAP